MGVGERMSFQPLLSDRFCFEYEKTHTLQEVFQRFTLGECRWDASSVPSLEYLLTVGQVSYWTDTGSYV